MTQTTDIAQVSAIGDKLTDEQARFDMLSKEQAEELKKKVRNFIAAALPILKKKYNEDDPKVLSTRLTSLSQLLPSLSVAGAISTKAYHKRKSEIVKSYLANPDTKKLGVSMIKDMAKDDCYDELALIEMTQGLRDDLKEEIGALRTQLSYYREELRLTPTAPKSGRG